MVTLQCGWWCWWIFPTPRWAYFFESESSFTRDTTIAYLIPCGQFSPSLHFSFTVIWMAMPMNRLRKWFLLQASSSLLARYSFVPITPIASFKLSCGQLATYLNIHGIFIHLALGFISRCCKRKTMHVM